jgi:Na+/H+-dicarboxylate symporter
MGWWFAIDLWKRVILALALGILVGFALRSGLGPAEADRLATTWIKPWGDLFLRLIRMLIVPLIFTTLVAGVIALGDPKKLGSLGALTIGLYFATTAIAVSIGLIMGTIFKPGRGLSADTFAGADISSVEAKRSAAEAAGGLGERLIGIVPTNPIAALASGDVLPIIFFAILFGVGHPDRGSDIG